MIKDSALQFLASIYQSTLSHLCSKATLCSSLAPAAGKAPSWCSHWGLHALRHEAQFPPHPHDETTDSDKPTTRQRWALPTHGKWSKQAPAPQINEKVSISITLWSTEQTLVIRANHGNYHQYQNLPDTSICFTWKILCGQGDMHVKDFASLPSISTPCSSARAADPTQRPNFPKSQASDPMGKLNPACKSILQYSGSAIRHAQDTWDRLSQSVGAQQQWTNQLDPDSP